MAMVTERSISGNLAQFNAANVKFNYHINLDLTRKIIKYADEENLNVAALNKENAYVYGVDLELDHGAMVPLYFIEKYNSEDENENGLYLIWLSKDSEKDEYEGDYGAGIYFPS